MKSKLSALEELRLEKAQLVNECAEEKERLLNNFDYAKSNWGRLLVSSVFSSAKGGVSDVVSLVSGKKKNTKKGASGIGQMAVSLAPVLWDLVQPMLIGFAIKKVKSTFSRKSKKKKSDS